MKKIYLLLGLILVLIPLALANIDPEDILSANFEAIQAEADQGNDVIIANDFFQLLIDTVSPLVKQLSLLVGGLFGIYLLLLIVRVYYERKSLKLLMDIRYNLDQQNRRLHLPTSRARRSIFERMINYLGDKIKSMFSSFMRLFKRKRKR
ncbi:MAG: hypothetical protein ABIH82_04980 [Candidatus Woesearchaeota archaeon]